MTTGMRTSFGRRVVILVSVSAEIQLDPSQRGQGGGGVLLLDSSCRLGKAQKCDV